MSFRFTAAARRLDPFADRRAAGTSCTARRLAVAALVAASLGVPLAHAGMRGNFDDADANHDGRVTLQEFESYVEQRLASANGPMAQRFRQLGPDQQAARLKQRFAQMDHAGKGYLDRNDWNGS